MAFKVYENRAYGDRVTSYDAETLQEAVSLIAREHSQNQRSISHAGNIFRLVETTETEIPFTISNSESTTATVAGTTVTA